MSQIKLKVFEKLTCRITDNLEAKGQHTVTVSFYISSKISQD